MGVSILGNIANSAPPNPLPPAAQVAGLGLCFDGTGNNVIGCSLAPSGTISSAMVPVVAATSIPAGRTALGLGTMAQEAINAGTCGGATIQDDGAGNARVVFATVSDLTNQAVTCAFHGTQHAATGALVYTLPQASTLFNGFGFFIDAPNGAVTITPNAADNFSGMASGAAMVIPPGTQAYIATNASPSGTWFLTVANTARLNAPLNLQLNASVASNAMTIAVKDRNGNDPSTASPVLLSFGTSNAQLAPVAITGPMSITVPAGAALGIANGNANRVWVGLFDNAGTLALGVYNAMAGLGGSGGVGIVPWNETSGTAGTAISSGATSAQTWYTAGAITGVLRILGYVESTQTTAGQWAASPTLTRLFGPGVKKPGDLVQIQVGATSGSSASIALSSAANIVEFEAMFGCSIAVASSFTVSISANSGTLQTASINNGASSLATTMGFTGVHFPNTTASDTYTFSGGGATVGTGRIILREIMGALSEPANDNGALAMAG